MAAQATQDHRISIIEGGSSSRTRPVQPVSLSGMTRTLGGFGQCASLTKVILATRGKWLHAAPRDSPRGGAHLTAA